MGKNRKGNKSLAKPGEASFVERPTQKQNVNPQKKRRENKRSDCTLGANSVNGAENLSESVSNVPLQQKNVSNNTDGNTNDERLGNVLQNGSKETERTANVAQHLSVSGELKTNSAAHKTQNHPGTEGKYLNAGKTNLSSASVDACKQSSVNQCTMNDTASKVDNAEIQKSDQAGDTNSFSEMVKNSKKSLEEDPDGTYRNVNASSPVVVVGRDSLKEMLRKMEKIIPRHLRSYPGDPYLPPPPAAELAAKRRRNAGSDSGGAHSDNHKTESAVESNSESSNQINKKKSELKRYPRIGNLMKSAKAEYKNIEAVQHVDKIRFCPSAFESQTPSAYSSQNSRFMSMPTSRYHDYHTVLMRRLNPNSKPEKKDTETGPTGEKQFVAVSELDADHSFAAETMTQAVIEYMRVEQLRVSREFVRCKKQRMKFTKLLESKNVSNESPSTQPTTGDERQWDVSTEKTQKENTSPSEAKSTDAETELTKIICKFLYNDANCLCQLDIYSWFPKANGQLKPCVCKKIRRVNKSAESCEVSSNSDVEDVDSLAFKVRTACEIFGKKLPEEVVRDEEFNSIAKQVSHSVAIEEYKREEERIREEKYAKYKSWVSKKVEIEARIERCLTVIKWASCNEEYMDYATEEDREFLTGVMIQENRLQKSLKELSLDNPNNGPPSFPSPPGSNDSTSSSSTCPHPSTTSAQDCSPWTQVDLSEISQQTVTSKAAVRLKSELSKLVTIFQMKHILLSLNLW